MNGSRSRFKPLGSSAVAANLNPPDSSLPLALGDPITVVLVAKAAADLQIIQQRTYLSRTDIVNRAVSFYEFIDAELTAGAELIVRRDDQEYLVKLM